ncbi:MAG: AAA family ATPase [Desulfuromonadaceae bacterium]|nr:AAA family ATPase [Desulfuromonadaceae bacterium]
MTLNRLTVESLRWHCCPEQFEFETTGDLVPLHDAIGQERALTAVDFALGMPDDGFNLFLVGPSGTGRSSTIRRLLDARASSEAIPEDWCYVHDLDTGSHPNCYALPAGVGLKLQEDVATLVKKLAEQIPKIFESKEYDEYRAQIASEYQKKSKKIFENLEKRAQESGFVLQRSVSGLVLVPSHEGQPLTQTEYDALGEDEQQEIDQKGIEVQRQLAEAMAETRQIEQQLQDAIGEMETEVVTMTTQHLFEPLEATYQEHEWVIAHLKRCRDDVVANLDQVRPVKKKQLLASLVEPQEGSYWDRYLVNLFVSHAESTGAPVVFEPNPTYFNLFGRIEHVVHMGNAVTNFTRMKSGALHRANGGYLVLNCRDVLMNYFSYEALKRCVRNREICMEDLAEQTRLIAMAALKPEPIPLRCKIIMIGEPYLYQMLCQYDSDFTKYFKVKADFDSAMPNTWQNVALYAQFIATQCTKNQLLPYGRDGVAAVVEEAARQAGDQKRLSSHFLYLSDLVRESAYYARRQNDARVRQQHVRMALDASRYRNDRVEQLLREMVDEGTVLLSAQGREVGQVNGLSVYQSADYQFGMPTRITVSTWLGKEGVISIDREAKLSGSIHDKGLMVLSGFFAQRFGQDKPVAFSASICFEQSYGGVDGDSASAAELFALMSRLSGIPLRQDVAVTGSVNQRGQIQAIGGVNEKIEGFFAVCKRQGLTGSQGVMIPASNVQHLMLRPEVVEACDQGEFHVWSMETIDEGIALLTGTAAGECVDGRWPEDSVNGQVDRQLQRYVNLLRALQKKEE